MTCFKHDSKKLFDQILKMTAALFFVTLTSACVEGDSGNKLASTAATEALKSLASFQPAANKANVLFEVPVWETTPDGISASVDSAIAKADRKLDAIAALNNDAITFNNSIAALDDAFYEVVNVSDRIDVIRESHQDNAMRDKALEVSKKIQAWYVAAGFREDVYKTVAAYADTNPELEGEDGMLLKETIRDYRRNGMALPKEKRDQLKKLKTDLNNMGLEFATNITEAKANVEFSVDELAGLPEDFLNNKNLKTENGTYNIKANVTWQYLAVMQDASNEETRKKLVTVRSNRAKKMNIPLFINMLKTRAQIAELLEYDNWADYRIEPKMAKTAKTAFDFEARLIEELEPKFQSEMALLKKLKAEETGNPDAEIKLWDMRYYKNKLKKTRYQVDTEKLKVYFQLDNVLSGMFDIFEEIFRLRIEAIEPGYKWVDDLRLYAVSDSETGQPLGLIYMDLFPRENKYGHFAQFGVTTGKLLSNGEYQRPVVALICNFPPATEDKPSLLKHSDVETLFHEFGHALHSVLTQTRYASFSGTSVPRDFVEAPSQMLENWIWDKSVLDRFAVDYRDPNKKIPVDTLGKMEEARLATIGTWYRRQLSFGMLDLKLHMSTDEKDFENFVEVSNEIMTDVYLEPPSNTAFVASFGHLGGGYDAGYYGYAWAEAISADLASVFEQSPGGLMDKDVGIRLREEIYAKGGSREIDDSITAFLGRDLTLQPFFEYIGLGDEYSMIMSEAGGGGVFVLGLFVFLGLAVLGYFLADAAIRYKEYERTVTVKGLAEQEHPADIVIWPVQFTIANNDLAELYDAIEKSTNKIRKYLQTNGIAATEITLSSPAITDKSAQSYSSAQQAEFRYSAIQVVTVYSRNIEQVRRVMAGLPQLGKQGIAFTGGNFETRPEYIFASLNDIKPTMIEQATTKAREVAIKFANDSRSKLGKIKRASQGQFSITGRDKNNPHIKRIRVVSTVEYYLSD